MSESIEQRLARIYFEQTGLHVGLSPCADFAAFNIAHLGGTPNQLVAYTGRVSFEQTLKAEAEGPAALVALLNDPPTVRRTCTECGQGHWGAK